MSHYVSTFFELWVAVALSGNIRSPLFFENFWSVFNALSVCVSWFLIKLLQFLPNLNHMVSHGLNPLSLRFNDLYFRSYQELARPTLIFDCRCNVASFKCKNNFSQGGATDLKKKYFAAPSVSILSQKGLYIGCSVALLTGWCFYAGRYKAQGQT